MLAKIFTLLIPLMAIGLPVAFCLTVVTMVIFLNLGLEDSSNFRLFMQIPQLLYSPAENLLLLAIPFFVMTGEVMNRSRITDKVMNLASVLVGWLRGGLAHSNIVASMLFAGITGSAVSDTVAIGSVMVPAMEKKGYERNFTAAVTAASSVIGPIIPPSIPMLIYASVMNVSVAGLFLGGILPGLLVGICLMIITWILCTKNDFGDREPFPGLKMFIRAVVQGVPALLLPVIIIGGILSGFFSPTQASAVAVAYGLAIGFLFYRTLTLKDLYPILKATVRATGMIVFILGAAQCFSWLATYYNLVEASTKAFLSISDNKYVILLIINAILLVVGMFMDMSFAIIVLGPLMAPVAYKFGMDPIHFGLMMCVNLTIGLATPPFGLILFAICGVVEVNMAKLSRALLPFLLAELIALLLITYVPFFTTFLPRYFGFM